MATGRRKAAWHIASHHLSLLANINRDPKKTDAFKPDDFYPYAERGGQRREAVIHAGNKEGVVWLAQAMGARWAPKEMPKPDLVVTNG